MNNGTRHNSPPPTRSGGNGTATAVRRNSPPPARTGDNGSRPHSAQPNIVEHHPTPSAMEALHWDALAPVVSEALAQPLDPALVSQRKGRGGRQFSYIEGHTAIDQANQVFGYGGWGYELVGDVTMRTTESADSRTGEVTSSAAYSAVVRVTVPGAPSRTDVGFQPVTDESAEGHETAFKGAVTDALKRALRSFGDRFGNGLYGDPPKPTHGSRAADHGSRPQRPAASGRSGDEPRTQPPPRRRVAAQPAAAEPNDQVDARNLRDQLVELSVQQGFSEEQVRAAVLNKTGRDLDDLGPDELNPLIASAADKLGRMQESRSG